MAQPPVVRALFNLALAVGAAGIVCAGFSAIEGGLMSGVASAAVSAGGGFTSGGSSSPEVSQLAASSEVVEAAVSEPLVVPPPVVEAPPAAQPVTIAAIRGAPEPPPAPPAPIAPGSVEAVIAEVFGEHAQSAIGVARCESRLNPGAISRGGGNLGLFQINTVHRARVQRMGFQWEQLLDARVNSVVARSIFDEQGWRPWACRHAA